MMELSEVIAQLGKKKKPKNLKQKGKVDWMAKIANAAHKKNLQSMNDRDAAHRASMKQK